MTASGQPCPVCGGNTRFKPRPKRGVMLCHVCYYEEPLAGTSPASNAIGTAPALTPAQIDQAHDGYTAAANYCAELLYEPEGADALTYLHKRGLNDDTIRELKIGYHPPTQGSKGLGDVLWHRDRTAYDGAKLGGLLGQQGQALSILQDAITLPYLENDVCKLLRSRKLNPQPNQPKYLSPRGPLYAGGTPTPFLDDVLADPTVSAVILTEGEFKAILAWQAWRAGKLSVPAVATPGGSYLPNSILDTLARKRVYLLYDVEARSDPFVLSAGEQFTIRAGEKLTGSHLRKQLAELQEQYKRAKNADKPMFQNAIDQVETDLQVIQQRRISVRVIRLQRRPDITKVDLDSYLLDHDYDQLQALIDRAPSWEAWYEQHGPTGFRFANCGIYRGSERIANYQARVIADIILTDGLAETCVHRLALRSPSGALREIDVPAEKWADDREARKAIRAGLLEGSFLDKPTEILDAVRQLSQYGDGPEKRQIYGCTGWQNIDGRWHYLSSDGAITSTGRETIVRATIDPHAQGNAYALCVPGAEGDAKRGAAAYLRLLRGKICPQPLALLLAAHAILPLIHPFLRTDSRSCLFVQGESGGFKTALLRATVLALYGPRYTAERTDGAPIPKWDSTYNGLELLAFTYRDAPLVIDDYKQATATPDALARFLHAYSESSSRSRMTRDRKIERTYPARCIVAITGEDFPAGDTGQLGRILLFSLKRGDVHSDELALLQRAGAAGDLAAFFHGFVQEVARHLDHRGEKSMQADLQKLLDRDDVALSGHRRTAGALRQNRTAWLLFCRWLQKAGYISTAEANQLNQLHLAACLNMADGQSEVHEENRASTIFLHVLWELLATGEAVIESEKPTCPQHHTPLTQAHDGSWFCRQKDVIGMCSYELRRNDKRIIGFEHKQGIALYPQKAFQIVAESRMRQGQPLKYTAAAVWSQLDSDGLIIQKNKRGGLKYKVRRGNFTTGVVLLSRSALAPSDSDADPTSSACSQEHDSNGNTTHSLAQ